jgi:AIPR protein
MAPISQDLEPPANPGRFTPQVKQAYIGYLKADQLLQLATSPTEQGGQQINPSVFFDNVRDFNPDSKINKSIIAEIKSGDRKGFVFRNNGVTVIAKRLNRTGDKFMVEDYQVVNGCQTTNILFHSHEFLDDLFVPFRLIESSDDEFITSIIVGTNTQNPVRDEQFWALRPFMKDLEEFCRQQNDDFKLFVERRENQYRDGGVERTRVIKPSDIMKAVAAMYLFQPHRAARDFRGIRAEYEQGLFLAHHNVVPYHLASYANYKIEFFVRNNRLPREDRIYKYYILCSVGYQFCKGGDIFKMRPNQQQPTCEAIRSLLGDETKFLTHTKRVITSVKELAAGKFGVPLAASREKLRDALRTETFSKAFLEQVTEQEL